MDFAENFLDVFQVIFIDILHVRATCTQIFYVHVCCGSFHLVSDMGNKLTVVFVYGIFQIDNLFVKNLNKFSKKHHKCVGIQSDNRSNFGWVIF